MESQHVVVANISLSEKHDVNSLSVANILSKETTISIAPAGEKLDTPSPNNDIAGKTPTKVAAEHVPLPASVRGSGNGIGNGNANGDVRVLTLNEYKAAGLALAEAFVKDHTSLYFTHTPDREHWSEAQKWDLHVKIMEYLTYAHLLKGLVVSAGPNYDCVALWMPPATETDDLFTLLRSGLWRLNYQLSPEGRKRFFTEFLPLLTATKTQVLGPRDTDSWYLVYLGTRPASRGRGYARQVVEYVTRKADETGKACYLESSEAVNRLIYAKMGFELVKPVYLQREKEVVQLDVMVREPRVVGMGREREREGKGGEVEKVGSDADSGVDVS